jgi:hypothetical protein
MTDVVQVETGKPYELAKVSLDGLAARIRDEHEAAVAAVCRQSISDSWLGNLREYLAHLV